MYLEGGDEQIGSYACCLWSTEKAILTMDTKLLNDICAALRVSDPRVSLHQHTSRVELAYAQNLVKIAFETLFAPDLLRERTFIENCQF